MACKYNLIFNTEKFYGALVIIGVYILALLTKFKNPLLSNNLAYISLIGLLLINIYKMKGSSVNQAIRVVLSIVVFVSLSLLWNNPSNKNTVVIATILAVFSIIAGYTSSAGCVKYIVAGLALLVPSLIMMNDNMKTGLKQEGTIISAVGFIILLLGVARCPCQG